jgi:hypothetical protein
MEIIDSIELGTVDGFDIRADMVPDTAYYSEPDGDYTPEQAAAFANGDWSYVGIIVTASRMETDLGSDSIYGMERGNLAPGSPFVDPLTGIGPEFANGYGPDMIDNAVADARLKLTELIDAAIDDSTGGE